MDRVVHDHKMPMCSACGSIAAISRFQNAPKTKLLSRLHQLWSHGDCVALAARAMEHFYNLFHSASNPKVTRAYRRVLREMKLKALLQVLNREKYDYGRVEQLMAFLVPNGPASDEIGPAAREPFLELARARIGDQQRDVVVQYSAKERRFLLYGEEGSFKTVLKRRKRVQESFDLLLEYLKKDYEKDSKIPRSLELPPVLPVDGTKPLAVTKRAVVPAATAIVQPRASTVQRRPRVVPVARNEPVHSELTKRVQKAERLVADTLAMLDPDNLTGFGTEFAEEEQYSMQVFRPQSMAKEFKKHLFIRWKKREMEAPLGKYRLMENPITQAYQIEDIDWRTVFETFHSHQDHQKPFSFSRIESRTIPKTDPRVHLRGQRGLFVKAGRKIAPLTVLGPYTSLVSFESEYFRETSLIEEVQTERYMFTFVSSEGWGEDDDEAGALRSLVGDSWSAGNLLRLCNDYRFNPLDNPHGCERDKQPNALFVEVTECGWPHAFLVAIRPIHGNEEILIDYGTKYWEGYKQVLRRKKLQDDFRVRLSAIQEVLSGKSLWRQKGGKVRKRKCGASDHDDVDDDDYDPYRDNIDSHKKKRRS